MKNVNLPFLKLLKIENSGLRRFHVSQLVEIYGDSKDRNIFEKIEMSRYLIDSSDNLIPCQIFCKHLSPDDWLFEILIDESVEEVKEIESDFLRKITHDLSHLTTVLMGAHHYIQKSLAAPTYDGELLQKNLGHIEKKIEDLSAIIFDLRDHRQLFDKTVQIFQK